ncbi:hypothetical protein ES703_114766 [subsurface metagenome]
MLGIKSIAGDVPASQCSEAKIEGDDAITSSAQKSLIDPGAFAGFALVGKVLNITASVGGNTGLFSISFNDDNILGLFTDPGDGDPVTYFLRNGGELILTRNIQSFAEFISAAGYAYTIKGAKLYTNIPSEFLQPACTILFDPLT